MLAQLYKDRAILFQDDECPVSAALMAGFEEGLIVFRFVVLVFERNPITGWRKSASGLQISMARSLLIYADKQRRGHTTCSLNCIIDVPGIIADRVCANSQDNSTSREIQELFATTTISRGSFCVGCILLACRTSALYRTLISRRLPENSRWEKCTTSKGAIRCAPY